MAAKGTGGNPTPGAVAAPKKRKGRPARPVVCLETGAVYASAKDAAKLCKIGKPANITAAIRNNTTSGGFHWSYAQNLQPDTPILKAPVTPTKRAVVCWETGEVFPSARDAARSAGVEETDRVTTAIARRATAGGFHWHWEGDPKPSGTSGRRGRKPRPVVCAETGVAYASASEAAAAVGVKSPGSITVAARTGDKSGGLHWYFQGEDGPKEKKRKPRAVVCWETDEVFPSEEAAAEWAGTTVGAINTVLHTRRSAGGYHWYLASKPKPDASELTVRRGVVCYETGEVFSGAQAAADAVGISRDTMYTALRSSNHAVGGYHWYPDFGSMKGPFTPSELGKRPYFV